MRQFRKATIREVAEYAGVSVTTVSLLLKGKQDVCSPETAHRIHESVARLNYTPGASTRGKSQRETRTVGVCVGLPYQHAAAVRNVFVEQLWRGILQVADTEQYKLLHYPREVRDSPQADTFLDGSIDGLLLAPGYQDPRPARLSQAGMPTVLLGAFPDISGDCCKVFPNEGDIAHLALQHLWDLGHRRIGHVYGPVEDLALAPALDEKEEPVAASAVQYLPSEAARSRREAYIRWMQERHAYDPALLFPAGGWFLRNRAELLSALQDISDPPTALFCANDGIAAGVIAVIRDAVGKVPEKVSVVGVDDAPTAAAMDPPLTTVQLPGEEVGAEAMRRLLHRMTGSSVNESEINVSVTRLIVRQSTAALGGGCGGSPQMQLPEKM